MRNVAGSLALGAALWAVVPAAQAAEIGPSQAQALEQQLRGWAAGLVGPSAKNGPTLTVVPEGDHFRISMPLPAQPGPVQPGPAQPDNFRSGDGGGPLAISVAARPLAGGRWAIDDVRAPAEMRFAGAPVVAKAPTIYVVLMKDQHAHATLDPAFRGQSDFAFDLTGLEIHADSAEDAQEQHTDRLRASATLVPAADGSMTLTQETMSENWRFASKSAGGRAIAVGADRVQADGRVDGLRPERLGPAIAAATRLATVLPNPRDAGECPGAATLPSAARAALGAMIEAARGLIAGMKVEESLDGVKIEIAGIGGATIRHMKFGLGGEAPSGILRAWMDMGLDGLSLPGLPPSAAGLVPSVVSLRPTVSGVPVEALDRLATADLLDAREGAQNDADRAERRAKALQALFAGQGVTVGIDALAFTLGPARFDGAGSVVMLAPNRAEGHARLVATGFDALTEAARSAPELARTLPVLILARGLAKPDGDRLVWDVLSTPEGQVTVNGVDLSAVGGAPDHGGTQPVQP